MGNGRGDGGGGNCARIDVGKGLTGNSMSKHSCQSLSGTVVPPVNQAQDARATFKPLPQPLPRIALGEHHAIWCSLKLSEQLLDKPGLDASGFPRVDQIANNRVQPRICINPKQH